MNPISIGDFFCLSGFKSGLGLSCASEAVNSALLSQLTNTHRNKLIAGRLSSSLSVDASWIRNLLKEKIGHVSAVIKPIREHRRSEKAFGELSEVRIAR